MVFALSEGICPSRLSGCVDHLGKPADGSGRLAQPAPSSQIKSPQAGDKPAQIDRNGVLILIRSSLLAVDQANKTGNYTVLRDLGAPGFQAANTATQLGEIFRQPA